MHNLISIGSFAQITQLSIKALHLYESMDLLRPAFIDSASGYRYYSITQLPLARRIRLLRSVDMSLDSVHAVVHAPTPGAMKVRLLEQQQRINERILKDQQALQLLQQVIDHQDDDLVFSVQVKAVAELLVAGVRLHTTPEDEQQRIPELLAELERYTAGLGAHDATAAGLRISHAWSDETVDSEIAVPLTQPIAGSGRIAVHVLESSTVAYSVHVGPYTDLWAVYWAVLEWIDEHGYERSGPPRELYLCAPASGQAPTYRTEVQWPIRRAASAATSAGHPYAAS